MKRGRPRTKKGSGQRKWSNLVPNLHSKSGLDARPIPVCTAPEGISPFLQRCPQMTIGMIFYVLAAVIFFLAGVGSTAIGPNPVTWGLFCLALGLLLDEYDFGFR